MVEKRKVNVKCRSCGGPLAMPATGRPPTFCGMGCRRVAEHEVRRITTLLATLGARQVECRSPFNAHLQGTPAEVKFLATEIKRATTRLRELLE